LAGLCVPLAFAPFDIAALGVAALLLLFGTWHAVEPRCAAWRGWLFGLAMFGFGTSWVVISMTRYGGMGWPLSVMLTLLLVAYLALFPALVGYLAQRYFAKGRHTWQLVVVVPALWVLAEWLRGWLMTGFPWLLLGYTQLSAPLAGLAPVVGVYGISWAVALSAGLLLLIILRCRTVWWPYAAALILLWAVAWVLGKLSWSEPGGAALRVSLIQGNVEQSLKWQPEQVMPTLARYMDMSREHWDSDLIIWPETAIPLFYHQAQALLAGFVAEAGDHQATVFSGAPLLDEITGRYYNGVVDLGDAANVYYKQHLVPFGEYVPLKGLIGSVLGFFQVPMSDFSNGHTGQRPLRLDGQTIAASICYEIIFPEEIIRLLPEASLLVNVSNDAWFGDSLAPHQHLQMARMRALETGRWVLRATNNGITALIDEQGRLRAVAPRFQPAVLSGAVSPRQGATPYVKLGNLPVMVLSGLLLVMAGWRAGRK
ncbi:MAG: apolipoprotein N-acyltransferase, partial [Gammaproteobacteria bacterium RBG_16_57_12]